MNDLTVTMHVAETIIIIVAGLIVAIGFSYFLDYLTRENKTINEEYLEKKGK
jgi:hypothetical protein